MYVSDVAGFADDKRDEYVPGNTRLYRFGRVLFTLVYRAYQRVDTAGKFGVTVGHKIENKTGLGDVSIWYYGQSELITYAKSNRQVVFDPDGLTLLTARYPVGHTQNQLDSLFVTAIADAFQHLGILYAAVSVDYE